LREIVSDNEQVQESFLSHLVELRNRLVWSLIAVVVVFICLVPWAKEIYHLLSEPMLAQLPKGGRMIATEITSPFFIPFKVTFLAAVVISLPVLLYQTWAFVAPGLYAHEKRLVAPLVIASTLLFLSGMAFAYFLVFPTVFRVMQAFTPTGVEWMPDIGTYLSFVTNMFLAFGVTFEVPIVVILLVRMGVVSVKKLREIRPYVIVCAFIVAAVVTPPDVTSQVLLALPLCLLYEVGLVVASLMARQSSAKADTELQKE
jgi:sec-independent protein translocase protein TatC